VTISSIPTLYAKCDPISSLEPPSGKPVYRKKNCLIKHDISFS
jgi:hypothetical protein